MKRALVRNRPPAGDLCGGPPDRGRRLRRHCGAVACAFLTRRPAVRRPVVGRRAVAAGAEILARHGHARPRSPVAPPLRRAHLARHRTRRERRRGDDRNDRRRRGRLCERVCRECADALHRSDDGLPGASARDRSGGAAEAEPLDRRAGDRARQLGAGGAHHLHRDARARGARLHPGRALARRRAYAHPFSPHRAASFAERDRVGNARRRDDGAAWRRRSPFLASACSRRSPRGATSSTRARATFRPRRGSCSFPARSFSRPRFPSILSATPCATCSTRPSGDAADGGAAGSAAHPGGRRAAWRRDHHFPAAALSAGRSGGACRRPQRQRADDRQRSPSAWPRSASAFAVLALSDRARPRRPWTLLYPAQRSRHARSWRAFPRPSC